MAENEEDMGKYAKHPRRTAGTAFLVGMGVGAGMMANRMRKKEKSALKRFINQIGA